MLKLIEQLINEHGSSAILKERLELISDRYDLLEEKNSILESKNSDLQQQLDAAKSEISLLESIIQQEAVSREKISENEVKVLRFLFDSNKEYRAEQIAALLGSDVSTAQYYLNELKEKNFIVNFLSTIAPTTYKISKGGIKYIVETQGT